MASTYMLRDLTTQRRKNFKVNPFKFYDRGRNWTWLSRQCSINYSFEAVVRLACLLMPLQYVQWQRSYLLLQGICPFLDLLLPSWQSLRSTRQNVFARRDHQIKSRSLINLTCFVRIFFWCTGSSSKWIHSERHFWPPRHSSVMHFKHFLPIAMSYYLR